LTPWFWQEGWTALDKPTTTDGMSRYYYFDCIDIVRWILLREEGNRTKVPERYPF
jgi:hypothetical protein